MGDVGANQTFSFKIRTVQSVTFERRKFHSQCDQMFEKSVAKKFQKVTQN